MWSPHGLRARLSVVSSRIVPSIYTDVVCHAMSEVFLEVEDGSKKKNLLRRHTYFAHVLGFPGSICDIAILAK